MSDAEAGYVSTWSGPALPPWLTLRLRSRATWAALAAALAAGLLTDQAFRAGTFGLGAALTVMVGAVLLAVVGRLTRSESRALLGVASVFAGFMVLRASPWLVWPDLAASLLLIGFAASTSVGGSIFDMGLAELAARAVHSVANVLAG